MIKTIKRVKEMNFRELVEYIIQNDVSGEFVGSEYQQFKVDSDGHFTFEGYFYGDGELYKVDVVDEITEDTRFHDAQVLYIDKHTSDLCVKCFTGSWCIKEMLSDFNGYDFLKIYALIDRKRQLVWEREMNE